MMLNNRCFLEAAWNVLTDQGFRVESRASLGDITADLHGMKKGRSMGPFFPYEDHLVFHEVGGDTVRDTRHLDGLHKSAVSFVESSFKVPRAFRYKVPNIITIAVSEEPFRPELMKYSATYTGVPAGGICHSVILVDLAGGHLISQGMQVTFAGLVPLTFKQVNPGNRALGLVSSILERAGTG